MNKANGVYTNSSLIRCDRIKVTALTVNVKGSTVGNITGSLAGA